MDYLVYKASQTMRFVPHRILPSFYGLWPVQFDHKRTIKIDFGSLTKYTVFYLYNRCAVFSLKLLFATNKSTCQMRSSLRPKD